jgi:hypothetical protein
VLAARELRYPEFPGEYLVKFCPDRRSPQARPGTAPVCKIR